MSHSTIPWADGARRLAFDAWFAPVCRAHGLAPDTLRPASADASFRRYFRVDRADGDGGAIVMDAPPPQEDVRPFIDVARRLGAAGLVAPVVREADVERGFLLLDDLGDRLYLEELSHLKAQGDHRGVQARMLDAIDALVVLQARGDAAGLPAYDDALLRRELDLFPVWCVQRERGLTWTDAQVGQWRAACDRLVASALAQPTVLVHRDWMPRNLMCLPDATASERRVGVLDFQDAVRGPITYDIASLLRDAFLSWDEEREIDWAVRYWERARKAGLPVEADFGEFWRQLEWMGLQRHLKVLGIFCRLKHRDLKPRYAKDLPRFFAYAHKVAARYNGLGALAALIEQAAGAERRAGFTF
jgi:aminoglycoside/choline kinase family phosphotransferase